MADFGSGGLASGRAAAPTVRPEADIRHPVSGIRL
jgi:hypothetical protein